MDVLIFTDDNAWIGFARYAGAYRIATELRNNGYNTKVIDFFSSFSQEDLISILKKYVTPNTLFIGFATSLWVKNYDYREYLANSYEAHLKSLFPHTDATMDLLFKTARTLNPQIKFVVGGSKAESLNSDQIDYWIIGQGETAVIQLADELANKSSKTLPKVIQGNTFSVFEFSESEIIWKPDDHIFPNECLPIEIARGCIFKCSFCYYPLNGKKKNEYTKSENHLKQEILKTYEKYGTETFLFTDDLVNDTLEKVLMIHRISKSLPFKLEWSGFCRLDLIYAYPEMITLLLESGLRSVYFGIETFDKVAGQKSGKGLGRDKILKTLEQIKSNWQNEVLINAGFIVGLPGETIASVKETLNWLLEDSCPIDVADVGVLNIKARPNLKNLAIYNSRIGKSPESFGLILTDNSWQHEHMNSAEAYKLVIDFYTNPKFLKKKRGAPFTMYPRLKNLGYSYDEISQISWGDSQFKIDATRRRDALFNQYKKSVFDQRDFDASL